MSSSQRLAAVAAISRARYNDTQSATAQADYNSYTVNVFFVGATICGVLLAICAACWRRSPWDYPEEVECRGVYTVSGDCRRNQMEMNFSGPPPSYATVVDERQPHNKDCHVLQEVVPETCPEEPSDGLPTYEAAIKLNDAKP